MREKFNIEIGDGINSLLNYDPNIAYYFEGGTAVMVKPETVLTEVEHEEIFQSALMLWDYFETVFNSAYLEESLNAEEIKEVVINRIDYGTGIKKEKFVS